MADRDLLLRVVDETVKSVRVDFDHDDCYSLGLGAEERDALVDRVLAERGPQPDWRASYEGMSRRAMRADQRIHELETALAERGPVVALPVLGCDVCRFAVTNYGYDSGVCAHPRSPTLLNITSGRSPGPYHRTDCPDGCPLRGTR